MEIFNRVNESDPSIQQYAGFKTEFQASLLVAGEGFEPSKAEPGDLQSPPIGRSGNPPGLSFEAARVDYPILMEANNRVKMASSKSDYFPATSFTKA